MTPELIALGRRAAACKAWRWMPGMAAIWLTPGGGVDETGRVERTGDRIGIMTYAGPLPTGAIPVLDDPATMGCLLVLIVEQGILRCPVWPTTEADVARLVGVLAEAHEGPGSWAVLDAEARARGWEATGFLGTTCDGRMCGRVGFRRGIVVIEVDITDEPLDDATPQMRATLDHAS